MDAASFSAFCFWSKDSIDRGSALAVIDVKLPSCLGGWCPKIVAESACAQASRRVEQACTLVTAVTSILSDFSGASDLLPDFGGVSLSLPSPFKTLPTSS